MRPTQGILGSGTALLAVGLTALALGCEGRGRSASRPTVDGSIVYRVSGWGIGVLDLRTLQSRRTTRLWSLGAREGGVGGVVGSRVVFSGSGHGGLVTARVYQAPLAGGDPRTLIPGHMPTISGDGRWMVSYRIDSFRSSSLLRTRLRLHDDELAIVESGPVEVAADFGSFQASKLWPTVPLGDHWIAYSDTQGVVYKLDLNTGQSVRLGGPGLVPKFGVPKTAKLICSDMKRLWDCVELDMDTGRVKRLRSLGGMVGFAVHPDLPLSLVVVPGRPRVGRDSHQLRLVDWRTGQSDQLIDDFEFTGRAVWLTE